MGLQGLKIFRIFFIIKIVTSKYNPYVLSLF